MSLDDKQRLLQEFADEMQERTQQGWTRWPQTAEEKMAWAAMFAAYCNERRGVAPAANRLDVYKSFEEAISDDGDDARAIFAHAMAGEHLELSDTAWVFGYFMSTCSADVSRARMLVTRFPVASGQRASWQALAREEANHGLLDARAQVRLARGYAGDPVRGGECV
jgi:hypothetical protein